VAGDKEQLLFIQLTAMSGGSTSLPTIVSRELQQPVNSRVGILNI